MLEKLNKTLQIAIQCWNETRSIAHFSHYCVTLRLFELDNKRALTENNSLRFVRKKRKQQSKRRAYSVTADVCRRSINIFIVLQGLPTERIVNAVRRHSSTTSTCLLLSPVSSFTVLRRDPGRSERRMTCTYLISVTELEGSSASDWELEHNTKRWSITRPR